MMTLGDGHPQATFCATLVDEWVRAGVREAVIAPGSRSTPLVLAVIADGRLRTHVHLDERSAAFFALGIGMATARPAVLICTSGTAAAHFHAAIIEADQAGVPLIACTADRPPELHDVRAPQTVPQASLYGAAARWSFSPGSVGDLPDRVWRSIGARSAAAATSGPTGPGPVHLNLGFRDPLDSPAGQPPAGRPNGQPWHRAERPPAPGRPELAPELSGRRGVIVAGRRSGRHGLRHLAAALGWPVLADARSQARGWPETVAAFDSILRSDFDTSAVEVVLRIGEPPASKVLSRWLSDLDADQFVIDPYGRWPDPERAATQVVHADPTRLSAELADVVVGAPDGWLERWRRAESLAQQAIDDVLAGELALTEPGVARSLSASVPEEVTLLTSSSMPVRDLEWFGHPSSTHRVLANRGANGIDGIVSTALGAAAGGPAPVVAILGDLAFLHDAGGLLGAAARPGDCVFVVVDNDGGGIFSFLPQAQTTPHEVFERVFATPHGIDLGSVAAAFGVPARPAHTTAELATEVARALSIGGTHLVVVRTDRNANVAVHARLHAAVAVAVGAL